MTLNEKMAYEVWAGFAVLVVAVGAVAGATLFLTNDPVVNQVKTQANQSNPSRTVAPFASENEIKNAGPTITGAILGGAGTP